MERRSRHKCGAQSARLDKQLAPLELAAMATLDPVHGDIA